jgi:hypothetical protein
VINFYYADPAVHGYGHKVRTEALAACFDVEAEVWKGRAPAESVIFLDCPKVCFKHASVLISVEDCGLPWADLELKPWDLIRKEFFIERRQSKNANLLPKTVGVFIGSGAINQKWFLEYCSKLKNVFNNIEIVRSDSDLSAEGINAAMRRHSVNIVTAGMMAYESLATGTPTVVVDPARIWDLPSIPTVLDPIPLALTYQALGFGESYYPSSVTKTAEKLRWFLKGVEACGR